MHDVEPQLVALLNGTEPPFTLRDAAAHGISRWVLDRLVRQGRVERLGRGLYAAPHPPPPEQDEARWQRIHRLHRARAQQAVARHPTHVLSHQTAALAYGWPVGLATLREVHLTAIELSPQSRREAGLVRHHSGTAVNEVARRNGLLLTSPARTVADCLRTLWPPQAVAVADGALRAGDTTLEEVRDVLRAQRRWRGVPRATEAAQLVDPRRETWLESYSFVALHGWGIDLPLPQVEVFTATGLFVARVDGLWLEHGVVGEADGEGKYLMESADDPADLTASRRAAKRVVAERHRERAIEDTGLQVVRWSTAEAIGDAEGVARRLRATFADGDISRFTGRLRLDGEWLRTPHQKAGRPRGD